MNASRQFGPVVTLVVMSCAIGFLAVRSCNTLSAPSATTSRKASAPPELLVDINPILDQYGRVEERIAVSRELIKASVPEPPAPQPDATHDEEWKALDRTENAAIISCVRAPGYLEVEDLYRNKLLNPADTYIPPSKRQAFAEIMRPIIERALELERMVSDIKSQELDELIARDSVMFFSKKEHKNPMQAASDFMIKNRGEDAYVFLSGQDGCYAATLTEMSATRQVEQLLESAGLSMALTASEFFLRESLLSNYHQLELLEFANTHCRSIQ